MQRVYRLLAAKNNAARRAVRAIREGVKVLAMHPEIGRPAEEMESEYREWIIDFGDSGYVVRYHHDGKSAVILAVRHQKEVGY